MHRTRAEMIESRVRAALAEAGPDAIALDLACNEGWFAHRLLEWGASRVVAIDIREPTIRRATRSVTISTSRPRSSSFAWPTSSSSIPRRSEPTTSCSSSDSSTTSRTRWVCCDSPAACTRGLCVVESQLTQQVEPIVHGNGRADELHRADGSFAVVIEQGDNSLASTGQVLSLVPNRIALRADGAHGRLRNRRVRDCTRGPQPAIRARRSSGDLRVLSADEGHIPGAEHQAGDRRRDLALRVRERPEPPWSRGAPRAPSRRRRPHRRARRYRVVHVRTRRRARARSRHSTISGSRTPTSSS